MVGEKTKELSFMTVDNRAVSIVIWKNVRYLFIFRRRAGLRFKRQRFRIANQFTFDVISTGLENDKIVMSRDN